MSPAAAMTNQNSPKPADQETEHDFPRRLVTCSSWRYRKYFQTNWQLMEHVYKKDYQQLTKADSSV
jgi:hypothetical protein